MRRGGEGRVRHRHLVRVPRRSGEEQGCAGRDHHPRGRCWLGARGRCDHGGNGQAGGGAAFDGLCREPRSERTVQSVFRRCRIPGCIALDTELSLQRRGTDDRERFRLGCAQS